MKNKLLLFALISVACANAQCDDNDLTFKFFEDSITIKLEEGIWIETSNSLIIELLLTSTEYNGIGYYERMKERGFKFIDDKIDSSFNAQLYRIWRKQK